MEVSIEARRQALQSAVNQFVAEGYQVVSQSDTSSQLVRPKNFWWLGVLFIPFLWPIYPFYYLLIKSDRWALVEVAPDGTVSRRTGRGKHPK